jgi:membrane-bound inhibitor of C-type lysozyme
MKTVLTLSVVLALASSPLFAASHTKSSDFLTKPVKKITHLHVSNAQVAAYTCKEAPTVRVQYFSVGETPAVMVPIDGKNVLFVKTLSASGERYVSGPYVWWNKGEKAFLEDSTGERSHKLVYSDCEQQF